MWRSLVAHLLGVQVVVGSNPITPTTKAAAAGGYLLLAIAGAGFAVAADFGAGLAAYRRGDFAAALAEWRPLAEAGMVEAQFNLGLLHHEGKGVSEDHRAAAEWYRRAADKGYARAQYDLAAMYESGDGVEQDRIQAYKWFRLCGREKFKDARRRRKALAAELSAHDMALAELQAREWRRSRREGGNER